MSNTAALVGGVFGTVQSKYLVLGSSGGVMYAYHEAPPSSDKRSSISHPTAWVLGRCASHSTLTVCPECRICPAVGEISRAEKPLSATASVRRPSATRNSVTLINPRVFIFNPLFGVKGGVGQNLVPLTASDRDCVKAFIIIFVSFLALAELRRLNCLPRSS